MCPYDSKGLDITPSAETAEEDARDRVFDPFSEQNMNKIRERCARDADEREAGEARAPEPVRSEVGREPACARYVYGPDAAQFEQPPQDVPEPDEPADEVGEKLTGRQLAFCEHYVECPVATRAARKAGYAEASAAQQASRLLKHPRIMQRILELRRKRHLEEAYRRESLLDKFETVFAESIERHEFYAAIQALTMQARLAGIREALPGFRFVRQLPTMGEQLVWDAVTRLEQKLCEITVGDYPGASAAASVPPPAAPAKPEEPSPPPKGKRRRFPDNRPFPCDPDRHVEEC